MIATTIFQTLGPTTITTILVVGAFFFGLSGGLAGVGKQLDFFGVLVLSSVVGLAGGALRDVFLGIPAIVIFDWRIVVAVLLAGVVSFWAHGWLLKWRNSLLIIDAVGLALFSVIGADISLHHGSGAIGALVLGTATGIGGGVVRDIVLREIPMVLRSDFYAIPALLGAGVVVIAYESHAYSPWWYVVASATCFVTRLAGIVFRVRLPRAAERER
jgi:uncharacterized membrane protein YeiH